MTEHGDLDFFNREVSAFIDRYAPPGSYGRDFEHDLRMLLSFAVREAQRPFVYELNKYRNLATDKELIMPRSK